MQYPNSLPLHLQAEVKSSQRHEDDASAFTVTTLNDREEMIWEQERFPEEADFLPAVDRGGVMPCATTEIKRQMKMASRMPSDDKLKWRSKYLAGSCVVYVAFLNGPTVNFKTNEKARIQTLLTAINGSLNRINNLKRNDGQAFSKTTFTTVCDGVAYDTDVDIPPGFDVIRNVKQFLTKKKYYSGTIDAVRTPVFLQSMQNFVNDLRDYYRTDWGIFLVCNASANRCWADASPMGMAYISEKEKYLSDMILHEILHLFGTSDEYPPSKDCDTSPYGWYDTGNYNCATPEGNLNCMMGNYTEAKFTGKDKICKATAEQLSLVDFNGTTFKPQRDKIVHVYNLKDNVMRSNNGSWLSGDVIRQGGYAEVSITGSTKMHPWYNPHGPEGDLNTIVGNDHLLPGKPFSCAVGRWRSLNGTKFSDWFHIGAGGKFQAPFTGFFTVAVNDKLDSYGDNSGYLDVTLKSLLKDNYGAPFVYAGTRSVEDGLKPQSFTLESND
jgi:hypothetical protein